MSNFEHAYIDLVSQVIKTGETRPSRAGSVLSLFGTMLKIECLEEGYFPILTQRRVFPVGVFGELAAFLQGAEDLVTFKNFGCNYWDVNAAAWYPNTGLETKDQVVGRIYGAQWRNWTSSEGPVDQLAGLVEGLKQNAYGRRHLLTTYNPAELAEGCLPPCHLLAQFNVRTSKHLDCIVTMRSVDLCLGLPSDIILYATLMLLLCNETGCIPGKLTFMLGDTHVYANHVSQFQAHTQRQMYRLPAFELNESAKLDTFRTEDMRLINYQHSGVLSYELNP